MGYLYPFPQSVRVTQRFGANPNNGINPRGGHTGDDYATPVGTPIRAAGDGVIELSGWPTDNYLDSVYWLTSAAGDALVLNCGDDKPTFIYGHNSDTTAQVGTRVRRGEIIGYTGNSGLSTGPHCHVETMPPYWDYNNGTYGRVNPANYFTDYYTEDEYMPAPDWYEAMINAQARIDKWVADKGAPIYDRVFGRDRQRWFNPTTGEVRFEPFDGGEPMRSTDLHDVLTTNAKIDAIENKLNLVLEKLGKIV